MLRSECIITGCKLLLSNEGTMCHGDLFVLADDVFIFNSVVGDMGAALRAHGINASEWFDKPVMSVMVSSDYCFERRGTFVFHRASAALNKVAIEYVGDRLPPKEYE